MPQAPKLRMDRAADKARSFAVAFGDTLLDNLATGSMPQFCPQRVEFHNGTTANETANMILEDGSAFSIVIAAGATEPVLMPVKQILATSGDNISVRAYWWDMPQLDEPQRTVSRGPA
jgi:hypothetical protein